jgi:hypothetical protein
MSHIGLWARGTRAWGLCEDALGTGVEDYEVLVVRKCTYRFTLSLVSHLYAGGGGGPCVWCSSQTVAGLSTGPVEPTESPVCRRESGWPRLRR